MYPILILVIWFLIESCYRNRQKSSLLAGLFFVVIAPQFLLTYQHTGIFSFLDSSSVTSWRYVHLSKNWYGYDTLISSEYPLGAYPWKSSLMDFITSYKANKWGDIVPLLAGRMEFYFSSFVLWSKAYLSTPAERIFSPVVFLLNFGMFILSSIYLKSKGSSWRVWLPLFLILAQSLLIVPEQRFVFVIQLFLVAFTYLYLLELIPRYFTKSN